MFDSQTVSGALLKAEELMNQGNPFGSVHNAVIFKVSKALLDVAADALRCCHPHYTGIYHDSLRDSLMALSRLEAEIDNTVRRPR